MVNVSTKRLCYVSGWAWTFEHLNCGDISNMNFFTLARLAARNPGNLIGQRGEWNRCEYLEYLVCKTLQLLLPAACCWEEGIRVPKGSFRKMHKSVWRTIDSRNLNRTKSTRSSWCHWCENRWQLQVIDPTRSGAASLQRPISILFEIRPRSESDSWSCLAKIVSLAVPSFRDFKFGLWWENCFLDQTDEQDNPSTIKIHPDIRKKTTQSLPSRFLATTPPRV